MNTEYDTEVVLPHAVGAILNFTRSEMDILIEHEVTAYLVKRGGCGFYYVRSELLAFRNRVRTNPKLAASIEYLLDKDKKP